MSVALRSIFDTMAADQRLITGIGYASGWHLASKSVWSRELTSQLIVEAGAYPEPTLLILKFSVFNATPSTPKTLRIHSPGHDPVVVTVADVTDHSVTLFTPRHRPGAPATPITFTIDRMESPYKLGQSTDERLLGMLIQDLSVAPEGLMFPLQFNQPLLCDMCLPHGWTVTESTGIWSIGPSAKIVLPGFLPFSGTGLEFGFDALPRPEDLDPLEIAVAVNGRPTTTWTLEHGATGPWNCPLPDTWKRGQDVEIALSLSSLMSPQTLGINADPRPLGIMLRSITTGNLE